MTLRSLGRHAEAIREARRKPSVTADAVRADRRRRAGEDAPPAGPALQPQPVPWMPGRIIVIEAPPSARRTVRRLPKSAPAPRRVPPLAADYRSLPAFRDSVYAACEAGLRGIGTRGLPVPPEPDYDLGRYTAGTGHEDFGPQFDDVARRAEAGFYQASRWFHSEDTAGFKAVSS